MATSNNFVHVSNVKINGGGSQATVAGGSTVQVSFSYSINDPCFSCRDQIEVGWSNQGPHQCVFDGITPGGGTASFSLTAPTKPGQYYVAVDQGADSSCGATVPVPGKTWWHGDPPDPDTQLVAHVSVKTAVDTFHMVTNAGKVGGRISIKAVHINGGGNDATVAANSDVTFSLKFLINDTACTTCSDNILVGLANSPGGLCMYGGAPGAFGAWIGSRVHLTAPSLPGSYFLAFDRAENVAPGTCASTNWVTSAHPEANPSAGKPGDTQFFGHLTVN